MRLSSSAFIFSIFVLPSLAIAAGGLTGGGGGDVIQCSRKYQTIFTAHLPMMTPFLADTFAWFRSQSRFKSTLPIASLPQEFYRDVLFKSVTLGSEENSRFRKTFEKLRFVPSSSDLNELDDDNIDPALIPKRCEKKQLAIQIFDHLLVVVKSDLFLRLHPLEQALFRAHETLIGLRKAEGDTTQIRAKVMATLLSNAFWKNYQTALTQVDVESIRLKSEPDLAVAIHHACVAVELCSEVQHANDFYSVPNIQFVDPNHRQVRFRFNEILRGYLTASGYRYDRESTNKLFSILNDRNLAAVEKSAKIREIARSAFSIVPPR